MVNLGYSLWGLVSRKDEFIPGFPEIQEYTLPESGIQNPAYSHPDKGQNDIMVHVHTMYTVTDTVYMVCR